MMTAATTTANRDSCPSWCAGDDEEMHAAEWDGVSDEQWHALARAVQGQAADDAPAVQLAVLEDDGTELAEIVLRLTPDEADALAEAIKYSADCARRIA
jgi:hypothetical protein